MARAALLAALLLAAPRAAAMQPPPVFGDDPGCLAATPFDFGGAVPERLELRFDLSRGEIEARYDFAAPPGTVRVARHTCADVEIKGGAVDGEVAPCDRSLCEISPVFSGEPLFPGQSAASLSEFLFGRSRRGYAPDPKVRAWCPDPEKLLCETVRVDGKTLGLVSRLAPAKRRAAADPRDVAEALYLETLGGVAAAKKRFVSVDAPGGWEVRQSDDGAVARAAAAPRDRYGAIKTVMDHWLTLAFVGPLVGAFFLARRVRRAIRRRRGRLASVVAAAPAAALVAACGEFALALLTHPIGGLVAADAANISAFYLGRHPDGLTAYIFLPVAELVLGAVIGVLAAL